jgi:hypothetical protein
MVMTLCHTRPVTLFPYTLCTHLNRDNQPSLPLKHPPVYKSLMACPRSFIALRGLFILLLNILTAVHAHSASRRDLHGAMIGHSYKHRSVKPISASAWTGISSFKQKGTSGVAAMQMSVVDDRYVILFDKAEHNPLYTNDGNHAWSALIDTHTHTVRALKLKTNSFCAGECFFCAAIQCGLVYVDHWQF